MERASRGDPVWHFDARRFGRELKQRREAAGYSTRRLARTAGVSQAYVVALEGSRSSRDPSGPCPSVEVLVGFASALGAEPTELLRTSLLRAGPHVLLVVEDDGEGLFEAVRAQVDDVDVWMSAGRRRSRVREVPHINLHQPTGMTYQPERVAAAVRQGLLQAGSLVKDRRVGLVFSETESTLLGATDEVLAVEHEWQSIVSRAAWSADAQPAVTLCVYELDVMRRMKDPLMASLDLIASHDTVWTSNDGRTRRGRSASMRVLENLRPPGQRADDWRRTCRKHLDQLTAA